MSGARDPLKPILVVLAVLLAAAIAGAGIEILLAVTAIRAGRGTG